jgi:hypothetical protein
MDPEPFVTADEVAKHTKRTRRLVLELTRAGFFPAYPLRPGSRRTTWRYKLSEIDRAITLWATKPKEVGRLVTIASSERIMPGGSPRSQRRKV